MSCPHFEKLKGMLACLVLAVQVGGATGSAYAIVATPQPIEQPIPAEWRAPVARFLHELGAPDVESILDSSMGGSFGGAFSEALLVRFDDRDLCSQVFCLTMIGIIRSGVFIAHAMFMAGKWFTRGDVTGHLLGRLIPAPRLAVQQRPSRRSRLPEIAGNRERLDRGAASQVSSRAVPQPPPMPARRRELRAEEDVPNLIQHP